MAIPVSLGEFQANQEFTVVKSLTADCILGADFLVKHNAVIDCRANILYLGGASQLQVPISVSQSSRGKAQSVSQDIVALVSETVELPARSISLIRAHVPTDCHQEGLVEPQIVGELGKFVLLPRTLVQVGADQEVVLQVTNTSPSPVSVYKGSKLGKFTGRDQICLIDNTGLTTASPTTEPSPPLGVDLISSDLTPPEQDQLLELLTQYNDVFATPEGPLGKTSMVKHEVQTTGPPIRQPVRRPLESLKGVVGKELQKMLQQGVVSPSNSPWSSPIVMVRKSDGSWRFCVDYRKVNSATRHDAYPLPRIDATLDSLAGSVYFTTLDLASGYWQVEMEEESKEKTAFSTPDGHYEFNVMPFGLTNAPATFQRLMECVLAGPTFSQCLIYLDDIIAFGSSFPQHLERLATVLQRLRGAGLKLKASKCKFMRKEVLYLGHIVSTAGVQPNPAKTEAASAYPVQKNVHDLRQFLGLANYYRRFVRGFSRIAEPLYQLTRKTAKGFQWTSQCQTAFEELKTILVNPPNLAYPDFSKPFILHTDASAFAIGGVLSQEHNGKECVISYWSRQLNKAERKYSTTEREALAAVAAIKEFYPYLYGFPFTLVTDHNPLTCLKGLKDFGGRLTRWLMFLQQFNFSVEAGITRMLMRCHGNQLRRMAWTILTRAMMVYRQ